jgi:hypothetical protein
MTKAPQQLEDSGANKPKYAVRRVELKTDRDAGVLPCTNEYVAANESKCAVAPQAGPAQPRKPIQSQHEPTHPERQDPPETGGNTGSKTKPQDPPGTGGKTGSKRPVKTSDIPWYGWGVIIVAVVAFAYYFGLVVPSNTAKVVPGPTATLRRGVTGVAAR